MKIKTKTQQHRFDFHAILVCEGCEHEQELTTGYDDAFYHDHVMPTLKCEGCKKSRNQIDGVPNHPKVGVSDE